MTINQSINQKITSYNNDAVVYNIYLKAKIKPKDMYPFLKKIRDKTLAGIVMF